MIDGKRVVVVVTARGGSKGVPRKNLRVVAGKPLLAWTLQAARDAKTVDEVVLSSDDEEILALGRDFGVTTVQRPDELSGDVAKQEDAVLHAMDEVERRGPAGDLIVLLAPTNPLRDAALVDEVVSRHARHPRAKATLTVVECEHHPLRSNALPEDGSMAGFIPAELKWKNRQELPRYYRISGSVCVADWAYFRSEKSFLASQTFAHVTDSRSGLDVDSEVDLHLAELQLRSQ